LQNTERYSAHIRSDETVQLKSASSDTQFRRHCYQLLSSLAEGRRVVEVGCGAGEGLRQLGRTARSLIGLESDEQAARTAGERYDGVKHIHVGPMSGPVLPLDDNSVDLLVCLDEATARLVLTDAARVLSGEGLAVFLEHLDAPQQGPAVDAGLRSASRYALSHMSGSVFFPLETPPAAQSEAEGVLPAGCGEPAWVLGLYNKTGAPVPELSPSLFALPATAGEQAGNAGEPQTWIPQSLDLEDTQAGLPGAADLFLAHDIPFQVRSRQAVMQGAEGKSAPWLSASAAFMTDGAIMEILVADVQAKRQPEAPEPGSAYILAPGKTGSDWAFMIDHALVVWTGGGWLEIHPKAGWLARDTGAGRSVIFEGGRWISLGAMHLTATGEKGRLNMTTSDETGSVREIFHIPGTATVGSEPGYGLRHNEHAWNVSLSHAHGGFYIHDAKAGQFPMVIWPGAPSGALEVGSDGALIHRGHAFVSADGHLRVRSIELDDLIAGTPAPAGTTVMVTTAGREPRLAFSDGEAWRWADGAAVSAAAQRD